MYGRNLTLMIWNGTTGIVDISIGKRDTRDTHCSGLSMLFTLAPHQVDRTIEIFCKTFNMDLLKT